MIYITGATGSIGMELSRLLASNKIPARAMCRRQEQLEQFITLGLEAVLADFDDPASVSSGLRGCDKLFLLTPPDEYHTPREKLIIDLALEAGIKHIVRISTSDTNLSAKLAYAKSHAEIDHYLRSRAVNWTILRPTGFMQNFLESGHLITKGFLPHSIGEGQISYIDLRDIALVAKTVLTEDTHNGAIYYLTGPESLTVKDVAAQLTNNLGYEVRDMNVSETDTREALTEAGLSAWYVDALIEQFAIGAKGGEIDVTEEIKRITREWPRTMAQFIRDYKSKFSNQ
jgi:uncharacterized protein YbjT (DUF2867 family)